ncbi:MAG: glycine cleavage system protein R [Gammaproteobacteria bacterium]|jgi:glycine cleavage system transcriptional repressor|nr:glycine cleavage system protein R [Gammaproteobacteria bacterium]
MEKLLAVTAIGPDRAGVVRDLSQAINAAGGSIRESRMIALGTEFAVMMLVSGNWHTVAKLQNSLLALQQQSDLTVTVRETQPRPAEAAAPYTIDVVTLDHEGIVFGLSNFFATRNLEISEVNTRRYNAPHTGALMFSVQMTVNVPRSVHVATLREEFLEYCDEQNLDAVMEPAHR